MSLLPKILVANFFPAFFPPTSGGEQRYYYLYYYLSTQFDITLLSPTYSNHPYEMVEYSSTFREHRVPKDPIFNKLHQQLDQSSIGPECSALVVALASGYETLYSRYFKKIVKNSDLVIHESPYTLPYDEALYSDNKPRIYNSYNVEFNLASQILHGNLGSAGANFVKTLEKQLIDQARLVLATCQEEVDAFIKEFGINPYKIGIAPNGFEPSSQKRVNLSRSEKSFAIFMGSAHPPNIEAALFILNELAPYLPELEFHLIGSVCKSLANDQQLPSNVIMDGFVSEDIKTQLLRTCTIALNPMFSGAGTNLKMLDYMAASAPIITTKVGARGLSLSNGIEVLIAQKEEFLAKILEILNDSCLARNLGEQARKIAYDRYTWRSIANSVVPLIQEVLDKPKIAPCKSKYFNKILVLNDFSVFQAKGGGQVRIKELLIELGKEYDVKLLCLGNLPERTEAKITENVLEICIPKTQAHSLSEIEMNASNSVSINDIIAADHAFYNPLFMDVFYQYIATAEIVIFEHPYLAPLLSFIPEGKPVIYSSLNCEAGLKKELLKYRNDYPILINRVRDLEESLLRRANLIVCVSEADKESFKKNFPKQNYIVIENGVRYDQYEVLPDNIWDSFNIGYRLAIFIGSAHSPNVDAARYIIDVLAPELVEILFLIVGSVGSALTNCSCPENVRLLGILDEDAKNCLMKNATIAINPLFSGGGSSLKVPDFFAAGLPLVSTEIGVRGYPLIDGVHYLSANSSNFSQRICQLLADELLCEKLSKNSVAFIKEYIDWSLLGRRYREALGQILKSYPQKKKLLVVSYRFTDPPLGGAEVYLNNLLRELFKLGDFLIDFVTYDVGKLTNKWHFSADYSLGSTADFKPDYLNNLTRFPLDILEENINSLKCRKLFSLWMKESLEQGREFIDLLIKPTLLGGWNFPEKQPDGSVVRWSSLHSEIFVGENPKSVHIQGILNSGSILIELADTTFLRETSGFFDFRVILPKNAGSILGVGVKNAPIFENDLRELGAFFTLIEVENKDGWQRVNLNEDYSVLARSNDLQRWVHSLIRQTQQRHPDDDQLFLDVRGPHSSKLMAWLDKNITDYDIVLAQGVPFASSVDTLTVAKKHDVRCVILPHFHMEDKYYHWRSFYQMFLMANLVLVSPNSAKSIFFDQLGVKSTNVIGGAVDVSEFKPENIETSSKEFVKIHGLSRPFILVLGRKAGAKNYRLVLKALAQLNQQGYEIDLVMIGPDDDGETINTPNTYYLGMQPRKVVIGALATCLCVINMSISESFGIVLIESWLAGKPVIVQRNCAAFSELVCDGENGFLVETPEEIRESVIIYLSNMDYARQCGMSGFEKAKLYTWEKLAKSINSTLLSIV